MTNHCMLDGKKQIGTHTMLVNNLEKSMLYSDEWIKEGYHSGVRISLENGQPIAYRYWYDNDIKIGATIDFEYAEDPHYEFLWEDFSK